jgi:glycosyltransferase involved in cell wall biosynthesis
MQRGKLQRAVAPSIQASEYDLIPPGPTREVVPVSVVIPCYRCAATIRRAVVSVAQQTVKPVQLILVDDASGDDTLRQLQALQARSADWIQVVSLSRNAGAGEVRNAGWSQARGEYLAFLDADDIWHPRKLEIQYGFMRANPRCALSAHRHRIVLSAADSVDLYTGNTFKPITRTALLTSNRFITPSVMLRTDLPFRFPVGKRHMEDHLLWLLIAFEGHCIIRLNAELAMTFKPAFGQAGLSSRLVAMERGELDNYWRLFRSRKIGTLTFEFLAFYSIAKFVRRCTITALRKRRRRD